MRNFKHSVVAMIAVAMISSLAAVQAADLKDNSDLLGKLTTTTQQNSITIEEENQEENETKSEQEAKQAQEEVETSPEAAAKSFFETGYVSLTSGTLNVRQTPSTEAAVIDSLDACDEVQILSSTDGWYSVSYGGGKTGFVKASEITNDKELAEYNAMHYDNYKQAKVETENGAVNVRLSASTDSSVTDQLVNGTDVVTLWQEGDFIKVAYGDDYTEGYVIDSSLNLTGEWTPKEEVSNRQEEVAEEKAEAARAEEAARRNSERASAASSSSSSSSGSSSSVSSSASSSSSSSKGQAIVNTAMQYLGVPYVWGGTSPSGFDCSGLVQYVCAKNGISVSRVADAQATNGTYVSRENLQPGDLVFFANGGYIHHVGIYIGNGQMIHAPQTGDVVKISSINTPYRLNTYAGACRVY